jgi:hypothetical protein
MAVIGATQLEPVNVLGQYVQGLEAGRAATRQRAADQAAMLEAQRAAELRNFLTATPDLTTAEAQNTLMRFGKPGAEMAASFADIAGKRATAEKTGMEVRGLEAKLADENYGRFQKTLGDLAYGEAPPTKDQVLDQLDFMIAQGTIVPQFRDYAASSLPDDPVQLQAALRGQFLSQIPPAERAKLFIPMSAEVEAQKARIAGAGAARTTVNLPPAGKKFSETLGETAGKRLDDFRTKAESAVSSLQNSEQLAPLLNDPKFISGTLANARLAVAKAAGIDVSATEAYFAGVGQQVAERITAFGAGTGLSDADREFAKKIAAGEETLSVESIRRIIRINDKSAQNVIDRYNKERDMLAKKEPEVKDYYPEVKFEGRAAAPANLSREDQDALNWANSNPNDPRAAEIKQRLGAR